MKRRRFKSVQTPVRRNNDNKNGNDTSRTVDPVQTPMSPRQRPYSVLLLLVSPFDLLPIAAQLATNKMMPHTYTGSICTVPVIPTRM